MNLRDQIDMLKELSDGDIVVSSEGPYFVRAMEGVWVENSDWAERWNDFSLAAYLNNHSSINHVWWVS